MVGGSVILLLKLNHAFTPMLWKKFLVATHAVQFPYVQIYHLWQTNRFF
jgi:hypothetical protein